MRPNLTRIRVAGFRSLRDVTLEPGPITVLIGPNGAGKSNLLDALTLAREIAFGRLQLFVSSRGGATFLLHDGPQRTAEIALDLELSAPEGQYAYAARLGYGADESLHFLEERAGVRDAADQPWRWQGAGGGHRESRLAVDASPHPTMTAVHRLLQSLKVYHFHDTSARSALRTLATAEDDGYLRSSGGNLPTFLLALRDSPADEDRAAWARIQGLVRRVAPFVREIRPSVLKTGGVRLDWVDDRGNVFGPSHLSDGTLRAIALITALGQPAETLPMLSGIDEPELGLHPVAMSVLSGLAKSVSTQRQVILSTQSPALLDDLAPEEVVVAERRDGATDLRRLDPQALADWLADYSLSELYDKNVLGGRP